MDDFLHNLRSGKLKQSDRGRRDYSDYKGPQRRAGNERRRTDYYAKVTGENFALVKDSLDSLAEQQKRIADALESIVGLLSRQETAASATSGQAATGDARATDSADKWQFSGDKLSQTDRPKLLQQIASMRETGHSWEKIARRMIEKRVPTLSGKGTWRGPAVKKFWDANSGTIGS
jgi:hypothetical protein